MLVQRLLLQGTCTPQYIGNRTSKLGKIMSQPPDQFYLFSPFFQEATFFHRICVRCFDNGNEEIENVVRCPHP